MSVVPGGQIPISCLHCKRALTVGSYHPLTDVIEHDHDGKQISLSSVLTELFPHKEEHYPNTSNKAFCQRCFDGVISAWKASKSSMSAVEQFISLSKDDGVVGFLGNDLNTYLNSHILMAVVKQKLPEEEVNWFSLVSYGAKKDMACYGSEKGVQFVQYHNKTLQTFQDFTAGLVSLESSDGQEKTRTTTKSNKVKTKLLTRGGKNKEKPSLEKKNITEQVDSSKFKEDLQRALDNIAADDPNNWVCAVCDKTFRRKKHALLHIRVAHKLSGEDVEKVVVDRSVEEKVLSKKRKRGDDSSESCDENEEGNEEYSVENPAKYQKQAESSGKRKDWECLECHTLFLWKRNLLSHLRNDHSRDLTEVQKYVQHNRKPSGKKRPSYYFTCARHSWKTFEHKEDCVQHIKRMHKLGYDKALKMVIKVNVPDSDSGGSEYVKHKEETQSDQPSPAADDCPTLSPVTPSEKPTQSSMPQLDPEIATSGNSNSKKEEIVKNIQTEIKLGQKRETPKLWACCLCGHKTTSREIVKRHLSSNHNMSRKNSERFIKYLGDEDEEEEMDDVEIYDDEDNDKTYSPISEKSKKRNLTSSLKPWKCSMCTCKYAHRKDLMRHRKTKHIVPEGAGIMWKPSGYVIKEEEKSIQEPPQDLDLNELSKEKEWACAMCGKKYFRRLDVHRHMRQKHPEGAASSEVACAIHKSSMDLDAWQKIEEPENDDQSVDIKSTMLPYACGMCGSKFKKRAQINRHLTDQHFLSDKDHEFYIKRNEEFKKRWKCTVCEKRYFYRFDVCRHVQQIHRIAWEKTQDSVHFLDEDSILSDDEIGNNGKIFMCARCRKGFNTKRSLISHIGEFHKCLLTVANIEEFVKDMRKVPHPILDYTGCSDEDVAGKVRATEFVNYIINHTKANRESTTETEGSVLSEKIKFVEINGYGHIGDVEWGKLCGTTGDLGSLGIYRPRKDDNKKRHVCMLCKKRYYRHKEAQRHLTQKHGVTYAESANYIIQDMQVEYLDESNESRPQRKPKRRLISKSRKYMLHCVKCLRSSAYFETLKKHAMKSHHLKECETHNYICRSSNADVLKLAYEDKMNFVCVLCGMTFKNRLDAYAHGPRSHSQYSETDKRNLVFEKTGEDTLYVVHTTRDTGKSKVFSINLESIFQDAHVIKEEDHDNTKIEDEALDETTDHHIQADAEDRSNSPPFSEASTKEKRRSRSKLKSKENEIEDFMCIMLDHYSQLGLDPDLEKEYSLQYSFDDFYMVFTVPGKTDMTNKVWCEVCMKVFKDEAEMSNHLGKCQSKAWTKWECLNCRKEFEDILSLVNHVSEEYGLQSESDILTYVRSKELIEVPDNNAFLLIDGRSDEEVNLLYHSLKGIAAGSNGRAAKPFDSASSLLGYKEYKPCFICGRRNTNRKDLFQHMKEVHKVSGMNKLTNCLECMMQFKSQDELTNHLVSIHNITIAHPTLYSRNCLVCNASFKSNTALSYHLKSHKIFTCPVCKHEFQVYLRLYKHLQKEHSEGLAPRMKCHLCPAVLRPANLEEHMVCHYDRAFGPWSCVVCGKEFVIRKHLKEHLKGRHNVFVCYRCGRQFDCLHTFRRHESVHRLSAKSRLALEEYKCDVCGGSFVSASMLGIHKQNKCQQFACHVCGRKMCNKASLASHIRNHQLGKLSRIKKQRTCSTCGKTLSSHAMWKRHQVVHSKQKPNHCGICGAKFSFINALRYHLQKKHPEYKPYKCPVCDQSFLTTHIRNFHVKMMHKDYVDPNKPIKCQYCDCRFKHVIGLRNHMKTKHQDKLLMNHKYFECQNCPRVYKKRKSYLKHARECSQGEVNTDLFNAIRVNVNTKITSRDSRSLLNPANQVQQNQPQYVITALQEDVSAHASTSGMETVTYVTTEGDPVVGTDLACGVELEATEGSQVVSISDSIITLPGGRQIRFQNDQSQYMEIPSDMLIETSDGGYFIVVSEANT